ncbi:MAG: nucleotidyltransferase family protein [Candidatus Omnitrophota bacterium]
MNNQTNRINKGVITAAGLGIRAHPETIYIPKPMLEIGGKPILQGNIELLRDKLNIKDIYIVINHLGGKIKRYFGNGTACGVKITYLINNRMKDGLLGAVYVAMAHIRKPFVCILGEEVYLNSNHENLRYFMDKKDDFDVICAVLKTNNRELIKKNYSVVIHGERITAIKEKPKRIINNLLGCGTYVFNTNFLNYLEKLKDKSAADKPALMNVVGKLAKNGKNIYAFRLKGEYVNVNTVEDLNKANFLIKSKKANK